MKIPVQTRFNVQTSNKKEVINYLRECLGIVKEQKVYIKNIIALLENPHTTQQGYKLLNDFIIKNVKDDY